MAWMVVGSTFAHIGTFFTVGAVVIAYPIRSSAAKHSCQDLLRILKYPIRDGLQQIDRRWEKVVLRREVDSQLLFTSMMCLSSPIARGWFNTIEGLRERVLRLASLSSRDLDHFNVLTVAAAIFCWSCGHRIAWFSRLPCLYDASRELQGRLEFDRLEIEEKLQWCRDKHFYHGIMLLTLAKVLHDEGLSNVTNEDLLVTLEEMRRCMFEPDNGVSGFPSEMFGHLVTAIHVLIGLGDDTVNEWMVSEDVCSSVIRFQRMSFRGYAFNGLLLWLRWHGRRLISCLFMIVLKIPGVVFAIFEYCIRRIKALCRRNQTDDAPRGGTQASVANAGTSSGSGVSPLVVQQSRNVLNLELPSMGGSSELPSMGGSHSAESPSRVARGDIP